MIRLAARLANLDRRVVYLVLVAVLSAPFFVLYSLPIYPETYVRHFYDTIEQIANDPVQREKVILVIHNWGPGTSGENAPQFDVIMRHLLRRRLKFVFLCTLVDPVYHDTAMVAFEQAKAREIELARKRGQPIPTWVYGEDYLDFGYINAQVFAPFARQIVLAPRALYRRDFVYGRDLTDDASFPLLSRLRSIRDVSAVLTISAGDESRDIAGLVKSEYPHLLIGPATPGIVATDLYPYVKSGQLFGLLNSARGASEYRSLLDPDEPSTRPLENALSAGKTLLLALVLIGNVAYLISRPAQRAATSGPTRVPAQRQALPPLPRWLMYGLFGLFVGAFSGAAAWDAWRFAADQRLPRLRPARPDDDPNRTYARYERVGRAELRAQIEAQAEIAGIPPEMRDVAALTDRAFKELIEARVGEFFIAFCTLGVFAFLLGDNRFYRFTEAIIMGGALAYSLIAFQRLVIEDWGGTIYAGFTDPQQRGQLWWLLLAFPGALWFFTYSRRYRWLNQLIVAVFLGAALGPEFQKQIGLVIPQVLDSIQPLWPWSPLPGGVVDPWARFEHLVFVLVLGLSLIYFVFFFRPKSRVGSGVLSAGRLVMMIGFGASFGNTVNTRLSWLAPRIAFLIEDWFGKLAGG